MIVNDEVFRRFEYGKTAIKHKNDKMINRLIDKEGFFNKIIVRFSFINIFAFC